MSAVVADIDIAAEGFGSAIHEISDDAPMVVRHGLTEPIQIGTAVAAQNVCHLEHRSAVCRLQISHQVVDRFVYLFHRGSGQVHIDHGAL